MSQSNPKGFTNADKGSEHVTRHNDTADTLLSQSKGPSAPSYAVAGTPWVDDSASPWVLKIYDGTDWITVSNIDAAANTYLSINSDKVDGFHAANTSGAVPISNGTVNANLNAQFHNGKKTKEINIGDWDMDANPTVSVAHGLSLADIRVVGFTIRNDAANAKYVGGMKDELWVASVDATNVVLERKTGGAFDDVDFDSTGGYNRGHVTIEYV